MSNKIREIRESRGWSQGDLGKKLGGLSQGAVYKIESGLTKIGKWTKRLCTVLDCTEGQLLGTAPLRHEVDEKRIMKDSMLMVYGL